MTTITIKNVPGDLYEQLKKSAERHRRSLNSEAIVRLEQTFKSKRVDPDALLVRARSIRAHTPDIFVREAELRVLKNQF